MKKTINKEKLKDDVNYILFNHFNFSINGLKQSNKIINKIGGLNDEITIIIN